MRGSARITMVCLVLGFGDAGVSFAATAAKEPVTGGLTTTPGVEAPPSRRSPAAMAPATVTPASATTAAKRGQEVDDNSWGVLLRGGYFGLPDLILNELYLQHPKVVGYTYGGEIRYHGDGGGRGVASIGLAVDYGTTESEGVWQLDASDPPEAMGGRVTMTAVTVSGYLNIFPSWWVHPYLGFGLGVGYFEVRFSKDNKLDQVKTAFPIIHIPLGLAIELGERLQLALETRFIDGIAAGGSLQFRF